MYDYGYYGNEYYDYADGMAGAATTVGAVAGAGFLIFWLISMAISVFTLVCMWKVFKKAGKPGWAAIVPIYNIIVMLEITGLPMWYIALYFVPFANIYAMFKIYIEFAKKFGKSVGFGIGLIFLSPIFLGILAFDKKVSYVGGQSVAQPQPVQPQPMYEQSVQPQQQMYQQPVQPTVNQSTTPTFCTACGNAIMPGTKFCTKCGKQLY